MTAKEKAQSLYDNLLNDVLPDCVEVHHELIKKMAVFVVDEILDGFRKILPSSRNYWEHVKKEINLL